MKSRNNNRTDRTQQIICKKKPPGKTSTPEKKYYKNLYSLHDEPGTNLYEPKDNISRASYKSRDNQKKYQYPHIKKGLRNSERQSDDGKMELQDGSHDQIMEENQTNNQPCGEGRQNDHDSSLHQETRNALLAIAKLDRYSRDSWTYIKTDRGQEIFCPPSTNNCCAFFAICASMGAPVDEP